MPNLRFIQADAYISDLRSIRDAVRANGTLANAGAIVVTHSGHPGVALTLTMNLALQPNNALGFVNGSLYICGFTTAARASFRFTMNPAPLPALVGTLMAEDGSYASLGYNNNLTQISNVNLGQAVADVNGYAGGVTSANVKTGLARLIICACEAVRFTDVASDVANCLKGTPFTPRWALIHNWDARTMGNN
jgi:hypothetical protein